MKHPRNNSRVSLAPKARAHMCHIPMRQLAQWKEHSKRPLGNPDKSSIPADVECKDATSLSHQHQEMERSQDSTGWIGSRDIIVSQKRNKDFPNRVTSSPSHTTQCWAKQNRSRKQIMNSEQKGNSEKREIKNHEKKITAQGTLSSIIFNFSITTHWHCSIRDIPQVVRKKSNSYLMGQGKEADHSTRTAAMLNTHAVTSATIV